MYAHGMMSPVVALIAWSLVMLIWLYATRIPAMAGAKIKPGNVTREQLDSALPGWATNPAHNYNHLMEQPTIFYATCFALQFLHNGQPPAFVIGLAWLYVALRVVHSLLQSTLNIIPLRFLIFNIASIVLGVMVWNAAVACGMISFGF